MIFLAKDAKLRVERVSAKNYNFDETVAKRRVLELPPNESVKIFVKIESLYRTWFFLFARSSITFFRYVKDVFILDASFNLSPSASVNFCLYEPAKSIKWILEDLIDYI